MKKYSQSSIFYCIYIFRASLSRIVLYFLSQKRYLLKNRKVSTSTEWNLLYVLTLIYLDLPSTKYKISTTLAKENGWDYNCCNPFLGPHIKNNKIQKKFKNIYYQKNITVKKCQSALKMFKNWLRMFKNIKINFWQYIIDWCEPRW